MLYLDTAATTPVDPRVAEVVLRLMTEEFGNAGSRTHEWGTRAKRAVQLAREQVASVAGASPDEVIFTSGATESDNIAILGLAAHGRVVGRRHVITSALEHKAVLEPLEHLAAQGFEVEFLRPGPSGRHSVDQVVEHLRPDTLLVSMMLVNNETGVVQPVTEIAQAAADAGAFVHVDAAQGFAKFPVESMAAPIDLVSISGHKIGAPKGVGALVVRRRGWRRVPLEPLTFGGGQERKLRPGTVPVALVAGLGEAAVHLADTRENWAKGAAAFRAELLASWDGLAFALNGDQEHVAPHIVNASFDGVDSEALVLAVKDVAGIATGSACTSASYTPSHVLTAMDLDEVRVQGAVRLSWWGDTDPAELPALREAIGSVAHAT